MPRKNIAISAMLNSIATLVLLLCLICVNSKYAGVPSDIDIDETLLPDFMDILKEADMDGYLQSLVRMGVVDTRIFLRLKHMDFQMMQFDWPDMTAERVDRFIEVAQKYATIAIANAAKEEQEVGTDFSERDTLRFGRLVIPGAVRSYEFMMGSFGARAPLGPRELVLGSPEDGCPVDDVDDPSIIPEKLEKTDTYKDKIILIKRGKCTFLRKAEFAHAHGAAGVLVVSDVDHLEPPSSGLGVDKRVSDARVKALVDGPSVIALPNTTWIPLKYSIDAAAKLGSPLLVHTIPIQCGVKGYCQAVLEEEMEVPLEVAAGQMRVQLGETDGKSFDFLSSTFGTRLPLGNLDLLMADPVTGCDPISSTSLPPSSSTRPFALVVHRGGCTFDVKAHHAQAVGAQVTIVVDIKDSALQRIGAKGEDADTLGIPSVLVTAAAGEYIASVMAKGGGRTPTVQLTTSADKSISESWINLAFTEFVADEDTENALSQLEGLAVKYEDSHSLEIVSWLKRRSERVRSKGKVAISEL